MRAGWGIVGLVVASLAAGAAAGPQVQDSEVHIENTAYNPDSINIVAGDTVTWDNLDAIPHTVTSDDEALFESGLMVNSGTFSHTFPEAGVFTYGCDFHAVMAGTVRVSDPNALPDLVVSGMALPDDVPDTIPGVQQRVDVTVRNLGANAAPATHLLLAYRYQGELHAIGTEDVAELGPDATQTVTFSWSTLLKVGDFQLVAFADSDGAVSEAEEGNNVAEALASVLVSSVQGIDLLDPV